MAYDHHRKAGNQGDCVKHPALIAALDFELRNGEKRKPFHYLDVFAGHAWHLLLDEDDVPGVQKQFEWKNGIGGLHAGLWNAQNLNPHVALWRDAYLARPFKLVRRWYPGSSVIAADVCRKHDRPCRMTLFDISDEVQADLRRFFQPVQPTDLTKDDWCVLGRSLNPTEVKEDAICEPDFVFIDPPGWREDNGSSYPKWPEVLDHILKPRKDCPTMMWMPTTGNDLAFKGKPSRKIADAANLGYAWSAVRWETAGPATACVLVYNCALKEIPAAVDCVTAVADGKWEKRHS